MSGQESLARSFMVLSFVSAGLIGVGHALDNHPQQSSPQAVRRALAKSPKLLEMHQQFAASIQPTRVAFDGESSSASSFWREAGVGDRSSSRQQVKRRVEPITALLSEQAVQLIASSGLASGSQTVQAFDQSQATTSSASFLLNDSTAQDASGAVNPANDEELADSSHSRLADESRPSFLRTARASDLRTGTQGSRSETTSDADRSVDRRAETDAHRQARRMARRAFSDVRPALLELSQQIEPAIPSSRIVVDLSDRQVTLWQEDAPTTTFPIAVGRPGWETPTGEFEVINKKENPIWQNPLTDQIVPAGLDNPLGTRWIGFWTDGRNQIGFHGTTQTELIGQAVSHGCIRMDNRHIEVLYDQIAVGVPVTIKE